MNTPHFNQQKLHGKVWGMAIDPLYSSLFMDIRDNTSKKLELIKLSLPNLEKETKVGLANWQTQLIAVEENHLFFVEYLDALDPTNFKFIRYNWTSEKTIRVDKPINKQENFLAHPFVYENDSAHHKTVMNFLDISSPLACEYFEWGNTVVISYYICVENGFERYLLLLKEGQKIWKLKQDEHIKNFSPGAFFVFQEFLIFIKNSNEICIYNR